MRPSEHPISPDPPDEEAIETRASLQALETREEDDPELQIAT
jgi:hypothetical protein